MKKIVYDPVPFCFGPTGKAISINKELSGWSKSILLARGTSEQLGKNEFDQVVKIKPTKHWFDRNKDMIESADLLINVMNWKTAISEINMAKFAMVDSLFWMWDKMPKKIANADFYFIQNFFPIDEQIKKFEISNPIKVGPIVTNVKKTKNNGKIVVHFGGVESDMIHFLKNSHYPITILNIISKAVGDRKVLFCGNGKVLNYLKPLNKNKNFEFKLFHHDKFLEIAANSSLIITTPGLTTVFELLNTKAPILFLPPSNYSQYLNLKKFQDEEIADKNINLDNLYKNISIKSRIPQKIGVNMVLKALGRLSKDDKTQNAVSKLIETQVNSNYSRIIKKQNNYFRKLGGNGTKQIGKILKKEI